MIFSIWKARVANVLESICNSVSVDFVKLQSDTFNIIPNTAVQLFALKVLFCRWVLFSFTLNVRTYVDVAPPKRQGHQILSASLLFLADKIQHQICSSI